MIPPPPTCEGLKLVGVCIPTAVFTYGFAILIAAAAARTETTLRCRVLGHKWDFVFREIGPEDMKEYREGDQYVIPIEHKLPTNEVCGRDGCSAERDPMENIEASAGGGKHE